MKYGFMTAVFTVGLCVGHASAKWNDTLYVGWLASLCFMNFGLYIADRYRARQMRLIVQQDAALRQWAESFKPCPACGRPLYGVPATGVPS